MSYSSALRLYEVRLGNTAMLWQLPAWPHGAEQQSGEGKGDSWTTKK